MDFKARQTVRVDSPELLWRATMGLPSGTMIADYLVAGTGDLEVRLLGTFPIAHMVGGDDAAQGEALRYLAELPLNPDAIPGVGLDRGRSQDDQSGDWCRRCAWRGHPLFGSSGPRRRHERAVEELRGKRRTHDTTSLAWPILELPIHRRSVHPAPRRSRLGFWKRATSSERAAGAGLLGFGGHVCRRCHSAAPACPDRASTRLSLDGVRQLSGTLKTS